MVQKVAVSREFEARLRHAATFFELGEDKAA